MCATYIYIYIQAWLRHYVSTRSQLLLLLLLLLWLYSASDTSGGGGGGGYRWGRGEMSTTWLRGRGEGKNGYTYINVSAKRYLFHRLWWCVGWRCIYNDVVSKWNVTARFYIPTPTRHRRPCSFFISEGVHQTRALPLSHVVDLCDIHFWIDLTDLSQLIDIILLYIHWRWGKVMTSWI